MGLFFGSASSPLRNYPFWVVCAGVYGTSGLRGVVNRATSLGLTEQRRGYAPTVAQSRWHGNGNGPTESWTPASSSAPSTDGEEADFTSLRHIMSGRTRAAVGAHDPIPPSVEASGEKTASELALSSLQFPVQVLSQMQ